MSTMFHNYFGRKSIFLIAVFFGFVCALYAQQYGKKMMILDSSYNDIIEDSVLIKDNDGILDDLTFSMPIQHFMRINANFGRRSKRRWHYGIDLRMNLRDSVFSVWNGIVVKAETLRRGYGKYVEVKHFNGLTTLYAHMDTIMVQVGDSIKSHTAVGLGGKTGRATGVHLHFEVRYDKHPFNPAKLIDFAKGTIKQQFYASLKRKKPQTYLKTIEVRTYHARKGDTISKIAHRYDIAVSTLYKLNGFLSKSKLLKPGQIIRIQ